MGKQTFCTCENKDADQLRNNCNNCEADQHLCFRYSDSTIPLLSKSKMSSFYPASLDVQPGLCYPASLDVQPGLCQTWSETQIVGFLARRLKLSARNHPIMESKHRRDYTNKFNITTQTPRGKRKYSTKHKNVTSSFPTR